MLCAQMLEVGCLMLDAQWLMLDGGAVAWTGSAITRLTLAGCSMSKEVWLHAKMFEVGWLMVDAHLLNG